MNLQKGQTYRVEYLSESLEGQRVRLIGKYLGRNLHLDSSLGLDLDCDSDKTWVSFLIDDDNVSYGTVATLEWDELKLEITQL